MKNNLNGSDTFRQADYFVLKFGSRPLPIPDVRLPVLLRKFSPSFPVQSTPGHAR